MWLNFFSQVSRVVRERKKTYFSNEPFRARLSDRSPSTPIKIIRTIEEYPGGSAFEWVWSVEQTTSDVRGDKELDMDMSTWTTRDEDKFIEVTFTIHKKGVVAYGKRPGFSEGDDEVKLELLTDENAVRVLEHLAVGTAQGLVVSK